MNIGNYKEHAKVWDWGGQDSTTEYEYWLQYAKEYGRNVLIPMCALGECGAYLARRGMRVTAFDITEEMIREGKKRFGSVENLTLTQADIRDFHLNIEPADFAYVKDLQHILSIEDVKSAFTHINLHLRDGGAFVLEMGLPPRKSAFYPRETFTPLKQVYPGKKVWKTGETRIDAETNRTYISQTVYIEDESGNVESFDHSFYLQTYERGELIRAFEESGFTILHEYKNREKEPWNEGDGLWIAEAVKRK